ncbi:flagellar biosynthesis protein FlhB [Oleiagrimonas sp. C23AA]|uniref:flagellar biosynthesis protein FlhB n=1 Tax=Oleiagrimonas sp. C23AA TaxID=2719047 RepID=UPI00142021BA|nr:flagellar biosynthesis protein FlhB [Oleiagrimonas sp. C23AA]NII09181.1 flagellar biosynthesis protein FlhB [Oleiagrimonas sp. C23AA]
MAENEDGQEKSEKASEKRLREAREKGDVPRSRDLSAAMVTLVGAATMMATSGWMNAKFHDIMRAGLDYSRADLVGNDAIPHLLVRVSSDALMALAPIFLTAILATFAAPALIGGFTFSFEALQPKPERLNPIEGIKKMVSLRGLVELGKSLLKVLLIGGVLAWSLWKVRTELLAVGRIDVADGIRHALGMVTHAALLFAVVLMAVGLLDAVYQKFEFNKKMRMTKQEVRDEHKETEGNPELKGRIRSMQQQVARQRMMQDVPKADVVITNPSHFAIALRYDDTRSRAPRVVAKGLDVMAHQIRMIAGSSEVPIVRVPPLARALYHTTPIGKEIPAALYMAVAQVLAYVYRIKQGAYGYEVPEPPSPDIDPTLMGPYRTQPE